MKKLRTIVYALLAIMFVIMSCEDEPTLGRLLDKSEIDFEVVQDLAADPGGNTVILKNNTPGTMSVWDYGTGRSNRVQDTVRFAFKGEYEIKFTAVTAGGTVEMDPVTVVVTDDNLNYVNDPLWTALSGGVGNEKAWVLDTEGKFFPGPISFYDPADHSALWWAPGPSDVYPNVMAQGDYGVMTFDLKGGAHFNANKPMEGNAQESGTYFLDVKNMKLTIYDATILRGYKPAKNGLTGISNWSNYFVLSLDENTMQLGVLRDQDVDNEGPAILSYNFISKEYSDNWVPDGPLPPDEGYNPVFAPGELLEMLAGGLGQAQTWVLDVDGNVVDWVGAGRGWTTSSNSSRDWGWNDSWVTAVEDSWIRFDRFGGQNYTRYQNGALTTGTFTINESTNEITLVGNTLLQNPASWMNPMATTIKVVKAFPGEVDTKGIWFGTSYDAAKDEWFVFHYIIPQ